jgi:hypothetical protein
MARKRTTHGPRIAQHLPRGPQPLYVHCAASWGAMSADTVHFPSPYPPAAEVEADLAALAAALQKAAGGDPVALTALVVAAEKVRQTFGLLGKYAQSVLRAGPIEDAPAIISSLLMSESQVGKRAPKPELEARHGKLSGVVLLIALAVDSALVYYWQCSLDQQAWTEGPQTGQAHSSFAGLTPGKVYYFRFRAFKRDGTTTAFSQVVSLMVQ